MKGVKMQVHIDRLVSYVIAFFAFSSSVKTKHIDGKCESDKIIHDT